MSEDTLGLKDKFCFGLSAIPDQLTYQAFQFLIFTFYFTVIGLDITMMLLIYILWGIWNAINDPLLGALSDRTKQKGKWGKRKFYLTLSIGPLCLMMILLFCVPTGIEAFYFLFIIFLFELVYTLFDVNVNALFPEMFTTEKKRAAVNLFVKGLTVFALIIASLLPTILVPTLVPGESAPVEVVEGIKLNYITAGVVLAILTAIMSIPFFLWGIKEKEEVQEQFEKRPSFLKSLKITFTNKEFIKFVIANTCVWYVFNILPTILTLYFVHVFGLLGNSIIIGLSLMLAFVIAALIMPLHRKLGAKIGMRNAFMLTLALWICTLFPFILVSGEEFLILGVIITALNGIPLSGALFYVDILHADVIEEDALKFGVKRSASYYGVNAFIHRLGIIITMLTIWVVFTGTGWDKTYTPVTSDPELTIIGLKVLIFGFPAIALIIGIVAMKFYTLHGEKLERIREELKKYPELMPK